MLVLISPAKRLDFGRSVASRQHTEPRMIAETRLLMQSLRCCSIADLKRMMSLSDDLAVLNHKRNMTWQETVSPPDASPALAAFNGDVYRGLKACEFTRRDLTWAQKHLRILSGLYGLLRPLDLIQPYRLGMGSKLKIPPAASLYQFWADPLNKLLNQDLVTANKNKKHPLLINLASTEYFTAVQKEQLNGRLVTPKFLEWRQGRLRFINFAAKYARGLMARFIILNRITTLKALKTFSEDDYKFNPGLSTRDEWVFTRHILTD